MFSLDILHHQSTCREKPCLKHTSPQLLEVTKLSNNAHYRPNQTHNSKTHILY